jgi:hypothetical protein
MLLLLTVFDAKGDSAAGFASRFDGDPMGDDRKAQQDFRPEALAVFGEKARCAVSILLAGSLLSEKYPENRAELFSRLRNESSSR